MIDDFLDPVPLHRTATFYLGLFPIVLLLWAWADSRQHSTNWGRFVDGRHLVGISIHNSFVTFTDIRRITHEPDIIYMPTTPSLGEFSRGKTDFSHSTAFPPPSRQDLPVGGVAIIYHHLPLWLILAAYLPLWLAVSYWHARRKTKRIGQSLPSAQPQTD